MAAERIVIVGAGPAGLATARAYRKHGGHGSVTLLGEEPLLPYRRPPLTKDFLRGKLNVAELPIEHERWFGEHDVDVLIGNRVSAIDPAAGTVSVNGSYLQADAIVLATGSEPLRADLPGADHPEVMTMRTLADSVRIGEWACPDASLLVLGTGFIGCEIAASLAMRGAHVTLVGQEILPLSERLGRDAAGRIAVWLEALDVRLVMETAVCAIHSGHTLEFEDGSRLEGDRVVLGMGVRPRVELARRAGLQVSGGAIEVDAQMRVGNARGAVFAVGDIAYAENASAARHLRVEHWGDALEHGEIAGRTLAGKEARWENVPGFWSTIGAHTLKYAAWGDGYDRAHMVEHSDEAFTVWYSQADGVAVGVLTYKCDADYERGSELIRDWKPAP